MEQLELLSEKKLLKILEGMNETFKTPLYTREQSASTGFAFFLAT